VKLVCPACRREHRQDERFCRDCGVPLVGEGGPAEAHVTEVRARARKIKPQLAEGAFVTAALGRHLPEAELIQNLLLEEGVPSTLRRTRGFDVPEMLAAGPRDVLVPQSGLETARQVLLEADLLGGTVLDLLAREQGLEAVARLALDGGGGDSRALLEEAFGRPLRQTEGTWRGHLNRLTGRDERRERRRTRRV
jgi:hypothetical protein